MSRILFDFCRASLHLSHTVISMSVSNNIIIPTTLLEAIDYCAGFKRAQFYWWNLLMITNKCGPNISGRCFNNDSYRTLPIKVLSYIWTMIFYYINTVLNMYTYLLKYTCMTQLTFRRRKCRINRPIHRKFFKKEPYIFYVLRLFNDSVPCNFVHMLFVQKDLCLRRLMCWIYYMIAVTMAPRVRLRRSTECDLITM